jgi:hypothetical protein
MNANGQSGKAAYGTIEDGKFVLSTYGDRDGAVIGKHRVSITEAWREDEEYLDENTIQPPKHGCEISPESREVEVVEGENFFELKAVPKTDLSVDEEDEEEDD